MFSFSLLAKGCKESRSSCKVCQRGHDCNRTLGRGCDERHASCVVLAIGGGGGHDLFWLGMCDSVK